MAGKAPKKTAAKAEKQDRTETYELVTASGEIVTMWHNIDTGETRVVDK